MLTKSLHSCLLDKKDLIRKMFQPHQGQWQPDRAVLPAGPGYMYSSKAEKTGNGSMAQSQAYAMMRTEST